MIPLRVLFPTRGEESYMRTSRRVVWSVITVLAMAASAPVFAVMWALSGDECPVGESPEMLKARSR